MWYYHTSVSWHIMPAPSSGTPPQNIFSRPPDDPVRLAAESAASHADLMERLKAQAAKRAEAHRQYEEESQATKELVVRGAQLGVPEHRMHVGAGLSLTAIRAWLGKRPHNIKTKTKSSKPAGPPAPPQKPTAAQSELMRELITQAGKRRAARERYLQNSEATKELVQHGAELGVPEHRMHAETGVNLMTIRAWLGKRPHNVKKKSDTTDKPAPQRGKAAKE